MNTSSRLQLTTSWDDGHPLDERLAEVLCKWGVAATFYLPKNSEHGTMDAAAIRRLHALGFELGGHTMSHRPLIDLPDDIAHQEIRDGKHWLEDVISAPVTSFCYPCGHYRERHCRMVEDSGFTLARTTTSLCRSPGTDRFRVPVSFQLYPHGFWVHLRHAVKEGNIQGLREWVSSGCPSTLTALTSRYGDPDRSGVLHLWGHAWEVEAQSLWSTLDQVLGMLSQDVRERSSTNAVAYASLIASAP